MLTREDSSTESSSPEEPTNPPSDSDQSLQSNPAAHISLPETLSNFLTQHRKDLLSLSIEQSVLLVFLRHLGCTFCRETLADIAAKKQFLERKRILPVFVHMSEDEQEVQDLFAKYGLIDAPRVSDPEKRLYRAFGLKRGTLRQILGPKVMWRGFMAAILKGHGFGSPKQDPFQLPGIFLLHRGKILKDFRHEYSSDRPDYSEFENCDGCI